MHIPKYPSLQLSSLLKKGDLRDLKAAGKNRYLLFSRCRDAIAFASRMIDLSSKDSVLIPSYICWSAVEPFLQAGANVVYFRVRRSMEVDWDDLFSKIDSNSNTRAIMIVHYFGFPQSLSKLSKLCIERKIVLIEDCSHTNWKGSNLAVGASGHLAVFSLPKIFPVPDGGALIINDPAWRIKPRPKRGPGSLKTLIRICNLLVSRMELKTGLNFDIFRHFWEIGKRIRDSSPDIKHEASAPCYESSISNWSRRILGNIDHEKVTFLRRNNFNILLRSLLPNHEEVLIYKYLPEGVCPLAFPLLLKRRDRIHKEMIGSGFGAYPWPFLPKDVLRRDFPDALYLSKHLLLLPIHQDVEHKHMRKMCKLLHSLL